MVDLSPDFGISCTFNAEDLVPYRCIFATPSDSFMDEPTQDLLSESSPLLSLPPKLPHATENIDSILDNQIALLEMKGCDTISLSEKKRPDLENSWITEDFRHLDPDLLERYQS